MYSEKVSQLRENAHAERLLWPLEFDVPHAFDSISGLLEGTIKPPDFSRLTEDARRQQAWLHDQLLLPRRRERTPLTIVRGRRRRHVNGAEHS